MKSHRFLNLILAAAMISAVLFGSIGPAQNAAAMPMGPTDETKVPHYFGPYPNWANSPFTLPDAVVTITGNGTGATAEATVGANGAITAITVTNPGHDYTNARVDITGSGTGAQADADIVRKGAVVEVRLDSPGTGYTAPTVTFNGNGGAKATAYGSVEEASLRASLIGGSGYTFPTVDIDMPDDPNGVQAVAHVTWDALTGVITDIILDNPGSGYLAAPNVVIRDGTLFDPINNGGIGASASATLSIQSIVLDAFGSNYNSPPTVTISDPTGTGAAATALLDNGIISAIYVRRPGSGYVTAGGIRKFVDTLPGLGPTGANNLGQYIPVAVPDTTTFPDADYYEIAVVEYTEQMHSDLPPTKLRGYVQLETSNVTGSHYALPGGKFGVDQPHYLGPTIVATKDRAVRITFYNLLPPNAGGELFLPVDTTIMGSGMSDMNEPFDPVPVPGGTVEDGVRNPMCTEPYDPMMTPDMCFPKNRATLHLHGGNTPWISDGTVHQWITPAGESGMWPEGVSVESVPDMVGQAAIDAGVPDCSAPDDGCMTFYYTNQQSARLMFYHDHSWGITRLNVYAGEAAGYLITDDTEQKLMAPGGALASVGLGIPLVIQDKTFVPQPEQLAWQDPTWDSSLWGGYGNLWYHHVYMPAQNPGDPGGMSAFGRWMYGPWFWPPAGDAKYGPIDNPYFNMDPEGVDGIRGNADDWMTPLAVPCNLDDPATWQYQEDPFCEPPLIPGTPNISAGMEQFNDTPLVNGTAYPTITLDPKPYRFRILSAANDRFFNFQWYVADPSTASTSLNALGEVIGGTEVALDEALLAAAQTDPVVFPTPDTSSDGGIDPSFSLPGPDWIQFGTEGGFLPAPVVVDGQQVTTWINDPTRFDVGNVDQHSLLLAPAERADVVVDFSRFAGQTLILYNDAPAAFPARIPSYDYYTGAPDLRPVGAPSILPGYGPNTRTIMQVKIAPIAPSPAFNLTALRNAFSHKANGSGVFESGQHPIIVGQAPYNSAYGTNFATGGWCSSPTSTIKCDGMARISQQGGDLFTFDTLRMNANGTYPAGYGKVSVKIEPKAIHDETNASSFDEFGRMQANLGLEVVPATPGLQNVVLHPFVFPTTEIIDASGLPAADVKVTPISSGADGSQIWKVTHNGVDTHPIHFHAYDVQLLNRVTWDNIIIPPDATELGWKDTLRIAPLEDTIIALRPVIPRLPWDLPNSIRLLSPMMVDGAPIILSSLADGLGLGMTAFAPSGDPIDVYNHYINFGAEYVYHCHILSHEEMDMMRPVSLAFPPKKPDGLTLRINAVQGVNGTLRLTWNDNSLSDTAFLIQRRDTGTTTWTDLGTVSMLLDPNLDPNSLLSSRYMGVRSFDDTTYRTNRTFQYRVVALNTVGDTWDYADPAINEIVSGGFPTVTTRSASDIVDSPPAAPTALAATLQPGLSGSQPQVSLTWRDNATNEADFIVQRSTDNFTNVQQIGTYPAFAGTGVITTPFIDLTSVTPGTTYLYRVAARNSGGNSAFSNIVTVVVPPVPAAPTNFAAANGANQGPQRRVVLTWVDVSTNETGFRIEHSTNGTTWTLLPTTGANVQTLTVSGLTASTTYSFRIRSISGPAVWSDWVFATPITTNP